MMTKRIFSAAVLCGVVFCASALAQGAAAQPQCCVGRVGDVNLSGNDEPTIGDVVDIVLFLEGYLASLPCLEEADINQSGGADPTEDDVTISDVSVLVDYLFITGPWAVTLSDCISGGGL
jgi:hypothetical protein